MYPELFHFLPTYGVLVAAAFLTALWLAGRLARQAGLNVDAVTNLGIYCALSAIAGAKVMMFLVDFRYYAEHPGEILSLSTLRAGGVGLVHAENPASRLEDCRRVRAGDRAGPRHRPPRLLFGRLLLGCGVPPSVGGDVYQSGGARSGGCAAPSPDTSNTALRSLCGVR